MSLTDQQWTALLSTIDWLTLHHVRFRGFGFKLTQLLGIEAAIIGVVEWCRENQRTPAMKWANAYQLAMADDLVSRQKGETSLTISLSRTGVTSQQVLEVQERLRKRGVRWCTLTN
jgi:hypothetical protein